MDVDRMELEYQDARWRADQFELEASSLLKAVERLERENGAMLAALKALVDGRPTEEPPVIAKIAHRNWELFQQARAAIAMVENGC